jgi:hypothetical protein
MKDIAGAALLAALGGACLPIGQIFDAVRRRKA